MVPADMGSPKLFGRDALDCDTAGIRSPRTIGMRISVVIPVYHRQALCERALRSALAQQVDGMETIIVDDGSRPPFQLSADTAGCADVRVLRLEHNRGPAVARNAGVGAARGEWIAFLDSDDYWMADTLRPRLESAELDRTTTPGQMTLHAAGFVLDNTRTGRRDALIPVESDSPIHFASGCWFSPGSTILFRKEVFERIGPYDPTLRRLEDLDWFLRFALSGGRLKLWHGLAAVIETGAKPQLSTLEESATYLQAKYSGETCAHHLAPNLLRRLNAYLDVERASIYAAEKQWSKMLSCMARSILGVPRLSLHLERFWCHTSLPQRMEPAGAPSTPQ